MWSTPFSSIAHPVDSTRPKNKVTDIAQESSVVTHKVDSIAAITAVSEDTVLDETNTTTTTDRAHSVLVYTSIVVCAIGTFLYSRDVFQHDGLSAETQQVLTNLQTKHLKNKQHLFFLETVQMLLLKLKQVM